MLGELSSTNAYPKALTRDGQIVKYPIILRVVLVIKDQHGGSSLSTTSASPLGYYIYR